MIELINWQQLCELLMITWNKNRKPFSGSFYVVRHVHLESHVTVEWCPKKRCNEAHVRQDAVSLRLQKDKYNSTWFTLSVFPAPSACFVVLRHRAHLERSPLKMTAEDFLHQPSAAERRDGHSLILIWHDVHDMCWRVTWSEGHGDASERKQRMLWCWFRLTSLFYQSESSWNHLTFIIYCET